MKPEPTNDPSGGRPAVLYVSYDGMGEPLGRSQVLGYLQHLAGAHRITLVSFEKDDADRAALAAELTALGIEWLPLSYHRRPPVLSTALDVLAGRRAVARAAARVRPDIVHVRSYVPALIVLPLVRSTGASFLFDIRGFWVDERVEGNLWRRGGVLYRIGKRCERQFLDAADAIVTLTHASVAQLRAWTGGRDIPIEVIPTCAEPSRFAGNAARPGGPHAVWSGAIGTWYRFDLAPRMAAALGMPLTVLTRQTQVAHEILAGRPADVRTIAPAEMEHELYRGDVGLCLIVSSFSKTASAPTRFAEYLAAGMPVAVTPGVGDLDALVTDHEVGVVIDGEDDADLARAAERLRTLAADPRAQERCRALAADRFDVRAGSDRYAALYARLAARSSPDS